MLIFSREWFIDFYTYFINVYIYVYVYIYIHMCIYIYTHVYIYKIYKTIQHEAITFLKSWESKLFWKLIACNDNRVSFSCMSFIVK